MSTLLQPGHHPDADQLSAFAEHALPAHEQQQTLAHLATCPDCRALVFLTQQAAPVGSELLQPVPARRPWFSGWNLAFPAAAALAGLALLTIHLRTTPIRRNPPVTTASIQQTQEPAPATELSLQPETAHSAVAVEKPAASPAPKLSFRPKRSAVEKPAIPPAAAASALTTQATNLRVLSLAARTTAAAITGQVTDRAGAIVPHAKVVATNTETGVQIARESTAAGNFSLAPLQPGNYTVEAAAPGFQRLLRENVQVAPLQIAGLDLKLSVGAASQTVTITDAPPNLETANATLGGTIENELYTNLPLSTSPSPRDPAAYQYLMPGVQEAPQQQVATGVSPQTLQQVTTSGGVQQGVYGGTGQTNLNENYIEGLPTAMVSTQSAPPDVAKAASASGMARAAAATASARPLPTLPSKLPTLAVATGPRQTLALDTAGTLFRSDDAGVTWRPIPTQWQGRALTLRLATAPKSSPSSPTQAITAAAADALSDDASAQAAPPPPLPPTLFELTTDTGATWISPDGRTWHRK